MDYNYGLFFALKAAGIKPPKVAMDEIILVVLKDYAVYKKWLNE